MIIAHICDNGLHLIRRSGYAQLALKIFEYISMATFLYILTLVRYMCACAVDIGEYALIRIGFGSSFFAIMSIWC